MTSPTQPMSARRTAIIGGLMVAAGPLSITLYAPALPTLVADLATTEAMGKLTLSVYFGAFALAQLVCGPLSDRFGRKPVAIGFFALYVLGSLVAALAPSIEMLLAGRALQGIGVSAGVALSRAMVRDQFVGSESIRILTLINLILTVAPAVAPTLGSALLLAGSWHLMFVVMAGFGLAIIVMLSLGARETQPVAAQVPLNPIRILANYRRLLASAQFMAPALLLAIAFGGFYGFSALLPFVLLDDIGLTPFQFAMTMLIQTGSFITGNLVAGQVARRASGLQMVRIGLLLLVLAGLGFAIGPRLFPDSLLAVMIPVGLWMLALAFIGPSTTAAAMAGFGTIAGAAGALTGVFQVGGGFVGSTLASLLFPDARSAIVTLLPIMAALALGLALWRRISARPVADAPPET
ncbi:Bcr/CflA family drug resistance efflux transporter [Devosia yakushimensis]|uniref:Bcr/CflA family efflux transporter n=1 Tax=Devosia yakushimensis TaxID=470028 RepID=A0ABQ5UKU8_9HYPH|nr:multidrug effflux MFS transporter [Devosia yakushimensis]GLQ11815.1 Bcr/CflA family drug resistance efflux transporter [Devosia yakushimensis]